MDPTALSSEPVIFNVFSTFFDKKAFKQNLGTTLTYIFLLC